MRSRGSVRGLLTLLACAGFAGCQVVSLGEPGTARKADPLQEALLKAEVVEAKQGWWKYNPAAVLKEVPPGTPVEQARSVMQGHGFTCKQATGATGSSLVCRAYRPLNTLLSHVTVVTFACRAGKVGEVTVIAYDDGR